MAQAKEPPAVRVPSLCITGSHFHPALIRQFRDTFADTVEFCATPLPNVPWLGVLSFKSICVIGPLATPKAAGCGECARQRVLAAAAGRQVQLIPTTNLTDAAVRAIFREAMWAMHGRSTLVDYALVIENDTDEESLHRVIPLPQCPLCSGGAISPRTGDTLLEMLAGWVDPHTGVIPALAVEPGEQLPFVVATAPPHVFEQDGSLRRLAVGWGKGLTLFDAMLSAVGEGIERYSASLPCPSKVVWARADELEGDVLRPDEFSLYSEEQYRRTGFPFVRFDQHVRHPWVRGNCFSTGANIWVPAIFAYLSLDVHRENLVAQGTSNGLACDTDFKDASSRAMLELVERDAFLAAWYTGHPGHPIAVDEEKLQQVIAHVESLGAEVETYMLDTSAFGFTAMCLAFGDGVTYPGVTMGLGAGLSIDDALRSAVLELGQTAPYLKRLMQTRSVTDEKSVIDMLDHSVYFFDKKRARWFDRLRGSEPFNGASGHADNLRIALVDVSSADVASGPFKVVRAVSPDLQALSYGYGLEREIVPRIREMGVAKDRPPIHPIW